MTERNAPRRVTIYKERDVWRYRVQATNWRTIAISDGMRQKRSVLAAAERKYPGVEVVEA